MTAKVLIIGGLTMIAAGIVGLWSIGAGYGAAIVLGMLMVRVGLPHEPRSN